MARRKRKPAYDPLAPLPLSALNRIATRNAQMAELPSRQEIARQRAESARIAKEQSDRAIGLSKAFAELQQGVAIVLGDFRRVFAFRQGATDCRYAVRQQFAFRHVYHF